MRDLTQDEDACLCDSISALRLFDQLVSGEYTICKFLMSTCDVSESLRSLIPFLFSRLRGVLHYDIDLRMRMIANLYCSYDCRTSGMKGESILVMRPTFIISKPFRLTFIP